MTTIPTRTSCATNLEAIDKVRALEAALRTLPQVNLQTEHILHAGISARAILIPAGTVLTGALTKRDNLCIVVGDISISDGEGERRLTGCFLLPAKAGAKRAGLAHEDTYWVMLHKSDALSVEEAEEEMTDEAPNLQTRTLRLLREDKK